MKAVARIPIRIMVGQKLMSKQSYRGPVTLKKLGELTVIAVAFALSMTLGWICFVFYMELEHVKSGDSFNANDVIKVAVFRHFWTFFLVILAALVWGVNSMSRREVQPEK